MLETFQQSFKDYALYFFTELTRPAWDNVLYAAVAWCLVCFVLEWALPRWYDWPLARRKGFWLDLFYVLFNDFLVMLLGLYALTSAIEYGAKHLAASLGLPSLAPWNISTLPVAAQLAIVFVVVDFFEWLAHYMLHRVPFLWHFHKIHHSSEQLGFASSRRFHIGEYLAFKPLLYIPAALISFSAEHYVLLDLTVGTAWGLFTHCNIRMPGGGWINYLLNNPETHYWHHAKTFPEKYRYGINFASVLNVWDVLFGHFHAPRDVRPEIGLGGTERVPSTFEGQLIWGFADAFGSLAGRVPAAEAPVKPGKRKRKLGATR